MEITFWSVRSSSTRGGYGVKVEVGEIIILASYKFHFIRVHNKLV